MLENLKKFVKSKSSKKYQDEADEVSVQEKEVSVFGEERLLKQKLFEKWAVKEKWHLKNEGILLLLSIDPESSVTHIDDSVITDLWLHAVDCVNNKLLSVYNPEASEDEWQVLPINLYCWAKVSRVSVPEELSALMDYVMQSIKPIIDAVENKKEQSEDHDKDLNFQLQRELVLGAGLSLLVNSPESCKSKSGKISKRKIAEQIILHSKYWFGENELLLSQSAIQDLIEQYILKGQNPAIN